MPHFPHHLPGGLPLVHGSTVGISQRGIDRSRGGRVYIDPRRGRGHLTEVRDNPDIPIPPVTAAVGQSAAVSHKFNGAAGSPGLALQVPDFIKELGMNAIREWIDQQLGRFAPSDKPVLLQCDEGMIQVRDKCVALGDAFPGGDPFITAAGGVAVEGSFGIPALTPTRRQRTVLSCGPRMVLGFDDLCYPKAVLPRRSKFRKWRGEPRPLISRRDTVAIRRAGAARDRLMNAAKDAGLHVSKSAPKKAAAKKPDVVVLQDGHHGHH